MSTDSRLTLLDRLNDLDLAMMQATVNGSYSRCRQIHSERTWVRRCLELNRLLPVTA